MKIIVAREAGSHDVLREADVPLPEPSPDEVLVRVRAAGVNFVDVLQRRGTYPGPVHFPQTPGMEIAGEVVSKGSLASGPSIGARVVAMVMGGGYSEYVAVPAASLVPIPEGVSFEVAAALFIQGLTAYSLAEAAGSVTGKTAFVSAAAGGIGRLLLQRLIRDGAAVVAGVSGEEKALDAQVRRASSVVRYDHEGWSDRLPQLDLLFDAIGGAIYRGAMTKLGPNGTAFIYGAAGGELVGAPPEIAGQMLSLNQRLAGHALDRFLLGDPTWAPRTLAGLFADATSGALEVEVRTYPLKQAAEAHAALESRRTRGKLVLVPDFS